MNLRYMLSFLRIMKTAGLYSIMKDWEAFIRMHFLFSAYESGLLNALTTPRDRDSLLKDLDAKRPELLDALLEVGVAAGELALKEGLYRIKGKRSRAVMGVSGDMLAAMIQANVTYYSDAYRNTADRIRGGELGDELHKIGALVSRFSKIVEPVIKDFVASIVRDKNPVRVLDVGCGSGVLLKSAYESNGNATGVGVDMDEAVVRQARENILNWGLSDRFEIRQGDIRDISREIAGPFHVITLYNILYYFDEESRAALLRDLKDMLSREGVLAAAMSFRSKGMDMATANLNMVNCSLKGLTPLPELHHITSLLKQCGFGPIKVHRFMPGSTFYGIVADNH